MTALTRRSLLSGASAFAVIGPLTRTADAEGASSTSLRIVTNDLAPQVISPTPPFRVLSCKDLVDVRNRYAAYSNLSLVSTKQVDALYASAKTYHQAKLIEYQKTISDIDKAWKVEELVSVKSERLSYGIDLGISLGILLAPMILGSTPVVLAVVGVATVFSVGKATIQLFQIKGGVGNVVEHVWFFNDAKFGTLGVLSDVVHDVSAARVLEKLGKKLLIPVSIALEIYGLIRTSDEIGRIEQMKALSERAQAALEVVRIESETFLKTKDAFTEYVEAACAESAATVENVWKAASLNSCKVTGSYPLSSFLESGRTVLAPRSLP